MSHMTIGKKKVLASTGVKYKGASVFDSDGNIQAGSKMDAIKMMATAFEMMSKGETIVTDADAQKMEETAAVKTEKRAKVMAAIVEDRNGPVSRKTGREMAGTINTEVARVGLMRSILQYQPLETGQKAEIEVRKPHLTAALMTGPTQARLQVLRDVSVMVPEVDNTVRVIVEGKRMAQSTRDLLQDAYDEGLTAILVGEDRMWKKGTDALIDATGNGSVHVGQRVSPAMLEAGMVPMSSIGYGIEKIIVAGGLWTGITLNTDFGDLIEPVTRLEIMRTGRVGTLFGSMLLTDAQRDPTQKVLELNEVYFASSPDMIGEYTDRGGVVSEPLTAAETGINGAGWHLNELLSVGIINPYGQSRIRLVK